MMQHATQENDKDTKEVRTVEIEQGQTPSLQPSVEKLPTSQSNFGPDMSGSDDDEASEVDSFILEEGDIDDGENVLEPSKFLLPAESGDAHGLQTVDPETHARLEALLEAAGISKLSSKDGKALTDPEVLRTLTSSVSSALDEAAQALHRMRAEQQNQLAPNDCARSLAEACGDGDVNVRKLYDGGNVPEPEEGESLLSLACSAGYYELAQVLLAMKANVEDRGIKGDCTPLMEAASGGHVDIVRLLISHGADVDAQSSAGNTPLHYAACGGYKEVVQELIKANARVEVHNENGHTPLMEAASAGHVEVARILLENGAGINTHSNEFKESALTLACYKGHLDMVKFLLEAGADQEHKTDEMHTALMEASMDGHVEVARLLLDSGAQVNMPADSFESPLTLAACGGHVELASLLIERGANIEEVNDEGYTPLMEAAREGHEEMVALLLSHDADINAQTEETQETALTLACCGGFLEVGDFLIKAGANIELGCSTPLMEAAQEGHLELVRYLLDHNANVHAQTGTGDTALTYACENGHTDVAELLLERGAELEHESEGGRTPLMKAARAGHLCTVNFIIIKGADVNRATTTNDHTVLSLACAGGHLAVVELLLAHGADPGHKLKDGSTMIIEAAKGGHTQVVKLLLEWPNRVLMANSPELSQLNSADSNQEEQHRVPVQGLANIVPPNEPDSQPQVANFTPNIQGKNPEQVRQNMQKSIAKRCLNGQVTEAKVGKSSNAVIADSLQQLNHDGAMLADLADDKASEKVEAIINNIMAKELINTTSATKEEQILRKQQILEELQKVERELQEKAQAQLLLSAQQQLEQKQQQVLVQTAAKIKNAAQAKHGEKKEDVSSQSQALSEGLGITGVPSDIQFANDIAAQLPKLLTSADLSVATQSLLPNYPEAFLQPGPQPPNNGASSSIIEQRHQVGKPPSQSKRGNTKGSRTSKNPPSNQPQSTALHSTPEHNGEVTCPSAGSQSQEQFQLSAPAQIAMDAVQRQQLQALAQQQQQQQQQQQVASHVQLPLQQDQLLQQMLQQPNIQQQFVQPLPQHALQQLLPQSSSLQQQSLQVTQQLFTQQQQQQFLQQQQQAQQLLQQQLQQQLKQQPANGGNNKQQQHTRKQQQQQQQRAVQNVGEEVGQPNVPILGSPPPSTPMTPNPSPASPQSLTPLYPSVDVDVDAVTESNHDTALTLACAGGHAELVSLLLSKGSDIEHRDKKGFTPLILAATAGHVDVVEILLDHGADIEAQSERTKDTPLSLACSGGRYEVVELLLARGANKEHRNVSDYTPLSLAASGGYVNIIKLLLSHGAEINSRTGSKLGISPLMLAAMNGHTAAVKLLLDMGSDINAQIETNRNTALTLACFQGRHEVVSLLVDRKANIEHRAKTGLTPLMEAASGGYVEVGRVLLERGADVNAPPVPSSRDTALTIAADKGHYRFVELLLHRGAAVDVKNKKGNSPLWLACNGGHLDVVQLLVTSAADIDSQDNRKVSCLMAAFRKGHIKVVKWMVKHVSQFPSDPELQRYIASITDKELQKKCQQCMEIIVNAKDRQAAEANKNATILLEEIDKERQVEENKKAQAAKKRERRRKKRKEKLEKDKEKDSSSKNSSPEPEIVEAEELAEDKEEEILIEPPSATTTSTIGTTLTTNTEPKNGRKNGALEPSSSSMESRKNKRNKSRQERERETPPETLEPRVPIVTPTIACMVTTVLTTTITTTTSRVSTASGRSGHGGHHRERDRDRDREGRRKKANNNNNNNPDLLIKSTGNLHSAGIGDLDDFGSVPKISEKEIEKLTKTKNNVKESLGHHGEKSVDVSPNTLSLKTAPVIASPKRGQKKEEGWKEVMRKSKKVSVPSNAISRVIGRGGCNINGIREVSGAHVEVEKPKGSGDRVITIKGSAEATRQANALIMALVQDPEKELTEILAKNKVKTPTTVTIADFAIGTFNAANLSVSNNQSLSGSGNTSTKSPGTSNKASNSRQSSSGQGTNTSLVKSSTTSQSMVWQGSGSSSTQTVPSSPRRSPQKQISSGHAGSPAPNHLSGDKSASRQLFPADRRSSTSPVVTFTNSTISSVSYSSSSSSVKVVPSSATAPRGRPDNREQPCKPAPKPVTGPVKLLTRQTPKPDQQPLPIVACHGSGNSNVGQPTTPSPGSSTPGEYLPFNNLFSTYGVQILGKKDDSADKMNFASVAAAGVVCTLSSPLSSVNVALSADSKVDPSLQAKAPGYKAGRTGSPQFRQDMEQKAPAFRGFHLPVQGMQAMGELDMTRAPGYRGGMPSSGMSPRSNTSTPSGLSPRSQAGTPLDSGQLSLSSLSSLSSQKDEYSMPNQPMTLPEIKSTLNPNAPDFQISTGNMNQIVNGLPGGTPPELHLMPPNALQALHQQLLNAQQLLNFNNLPQGNFPMPNELQMIQQLSSVGNQMPNQMGNQMPNHMNSQLPSHMSNQINNQMPNQIPNQMGRDHLGGQMGNNQLGQMASQLAQGGGQNPPVGPPGPAPQSPAPGFLPQMMSRTLSPMPPHARPNSAPSMAAMSQVEGGSPGPIGPPRGTSPMPVGTPPLPDSVKNSMDDRRVPRPIGGERSHRKGPGTSAGPSPGPGNLGPVGDYSKLWGLNSAISELNSEWVPSTSPMMSNASMQASVRTSSVITGGTMAYTREGDGPGPDQSQDANSFPEGLTLEAAMEQSFQNPQMLMAMFPNGVPSNFPLPPMFNPRMSGDAVPATMWAAGMKAPPSEPVENGNNWTTWSQQADM